MAGTYILTRSASESLHDRFNKQLLDTARGGADALAQAEAQQIAGLRAVIYTQGFSDAVVARNGADLTRLAAPQALNYGFDHLIVVADDGTFVAALPQLPSDQPAADTSPDLKTLAAAVLHPSGKLDKLSQAVSTPQGWVFYTGGPVRSGDKVVGAVLAGTNVQRLLRQVGRSSSSDGVAYYAGNGTPVDYELAASSSGQSPSALPALPNGWYDSITSDSKAPAKFRTVTLLGNQTYIEALGIVPGRSLSDRAPGVYGVMLNAGALNGKLQDNMWLLILVFGLALVLIVITGIMQRGLAGRQVQEVRAHTIEGA